MKVDAQITVGVRTSAFRGAFLFFQDVLKLEVIHCDEPMEFVQFLLPGGDVLELLGKQDSWHPFTTSPEWELVIDRLTTTFGEDGPSQAPAEHPGLSSPGLGSRAYWSDF